MTQTIQTIQSDKPLPEKSPLLHQTRSEGLLSIIFLSLVLLGFWGAWFYPLTPAVVEALVTSLGASKHLGSNHFVDQRTMLGIANALDVLSNLPFLMFGVWGLMRLRAYQAALHAARLAHTSSALLPFTVFFVGLVLTTFGSGWYHLAPTNASLVWDRAGMAFAFAGMFGIAAYERTSPRSAAWLSLLMLLCAALSLWYWSRTQDVGPWFVLQFGGMVLVLLIALQKPRAHALGVPLVGVIVLYAMSKLAEGMDHAIFQQSGHTISGHSLKHLIAALAALPVIFTISLTPSPVNGRGEQLSPPSPASGRGEHKKDQL